MRRLELTQESFAKFAYWTNSETNSGSTIYFANGDQLWGPVWSNDDINIASSGATFHDVVGTAGAVNGVGYGTFAKGYATNQKPITLPSLTTLSNLSGLATVSGMNYTPPTTGDESTVRMRIEFVAADIDGNGDSTAQNEGFYRIYTATSGNQNWLRGDWPGTSSSLPSVASVINCGDWHTVTNPNNGKLDTLFFPAAVHPNSGWFPRRVASARVVEPATTIMGHTSTRRAARAATWAATRISSPVTRQGQRRPTRPPTSRRAAATRRSRRPTAAVRGGCTARRRTPRSTRKRTVGREVSVSRSIADTTPPPRA